MSDSSENNMEQPDTSVFSDVDLISSFSEFEDMRRKGELIDCKIAVQSGCISAHRVILAARIPLFRKLLKASAIGVIRIEEEMDPDILASVINFAYTGSVEITTDNVRVILLASGYLEISKVYEACWTFLANRLSHENVWQIRKLAEDHHRSSVVEICDGYIKNNFEVFSKSDSFKNLPFSYLLEVIGKDDIRISTEETRFEAIISWVNFSPVKLEVGARRKDLLPELLSAVRVQHLAPKYLIERVSKEDVLRGSLACRDWLDDAKNYHLSLYTQNLENHDFAPRQKSEERLQPVSFVPNSDLGIYAVCNSGTKFFVKFMDSRREKWNTLSERLLVDVYHVFAVGTKIYIFCKSSTQIFDVKTQEWHGLETEHGPLRSSALVSLGDVFYSFGGKGYFLSRLVRLFDSQQNKWIAEDQMTKSRMASSGAALNKTIYVTGGRQNTSNEDVLRAEDVYNDVEQYAPQTKTWKEIKPMLFRRCDHSCTSLDEKIYVCGGRSPTYLDTAEVYDPSTKNWSCILPMNADKHFYSLISYDGKLYTLSKWVHARVPVTDVNIYEPELNTWTAGIPILGHHDCINAFLVCAATPEESTVKGTESDLNKKKPDLNNTKEPDSV